jgi:hypothetical protein
LRHQEPHFVKTPPFQLTREKERRDKRLLS